MKRLESARTILEFECGALSAAQRIYGAVRAMPSGLTRSALQGDPRFDRATAFAPCATGIDDFIAALRAVCTDLVSPDIGPIPAQTEDAK